ncbi:hypothetical protein CSPAE12_06320 [Colletotrichum incanum]|nr:hypothetical protein CSPAE12_06320 [Colletotrichum incanum]
MPCKKVLKHNPHNNNRHTKTFSRSVCKNHHGPEESFIAPAHYTKDIVQNIVQDSDLISPQEAVHQHIIDSNALLLHKELDFRNIDCLNAQIQASGQQPTSSLHQELPNHLGMMLPSPSGSQGTRYSDLDVDMGSYGATLGVLNWANTLPCPQHGRK